MPSNYTFSSGNNGVANFSVALKTAGSQSITSTDTGTGSITGSQAGITVSATRPPSSRSPARHAHERHLLVRVHDHVAGPVRKLLECLGRPDDQLDGRQRYLL